MRDLPFDFVSFSIFFLSPRPWTAYHLVRRSQFLQEYPMASDIFAKIGDIKGESLDSKHKDEIEVLSFSWGVTNTGATAAGGGGGAGKATFQDLSIVHKIDNASPLLMKACATGAHLKEATITYRKAGKDQQDYLIVKMNDIIITGVTDGATSGQAGSETVSLAFAKIDLEYKPQKADGSLDTGIHFKFDLKANKEG
jgi:type VI secretion system secreted protein Hcp